MGLFKRLKAWDAHHRLLVALLGALAVVLSFGGRWSTPVLAVVAWDVFAVILLVLAWVRIGVGRPTHFLKGAQLQDFGNKVIFIGVLTAACISLFAVGYLLGSDRPVEKQALISHALLSIATVGCSWALIHTLFALHYARLYHGDRRDHGDPGGKTGGINFPGEEDPDYLDFAYFAFVIGMTCQTSDVNITGKSIRRLALLHGLVGFIFNATILALVINIVSTIVAD